MRISEDRNDKVIFISVINPVYRPTLVKQEDENTPKWLEDDDLGKGRTRYLGNDEKSFWKDLIKKYLLPLERNEEQQKKVQQELLELRNKMSMMFFMLNGLFIVIIFTLQVSVSYTFNISMVWCNNNKCYTTWNKEKRCVCVLRYAMDFTSYVSTLLGFNRIIVCPICKYNVFMVIQSLPCLCCNNLQIFYSFATKSIDAYPLLLTSLKLYIAWIACQLF